VTRRRAVVVRYHPDCDPQARRETRALRDAGFDVELVCVRQAGQARRERVDGVLVRRVGVTKRRGGPLRYLAEYLWWFLACAALLSWHHLRRPYSLVQVTTLPDHQVFAAAVPKWLGARVLLFFKEPFAELAATELGRGEGAVRRLALASARFADHCLAVTDQHRQSYLDAGLEPDRIDVVLNATEPVFPDEPPEPIDAHRLVVMCHGTIEARYGHEVLIRAAAAARREVPELLVVVCGRGTAEADVAALVDRLELREVVQLRGWVDERRLSALLNRADVGVVAQLANPYSHLVHTVKMFDFLQRGVPVVAGDLRSTRAYFGDVIETYDPADPAQLANRLIALARDPERRRALGAAGRRAVAAHAAHRQVARYVEVVETLTATGKGGGDGTPGLEAAGPRPVAAPG
jgi:glycosyltransferase involved in cell wall biosynthesis